MVCMTPMPPAVAEFNRRHPKAVIKITQSIFRPIENRLADGLLDFWVGTVDENTVSQRFSVECLLPHSRRIAARRDHPLLSAKSLNELAGAEPVRPSLEDRSVETDIEEAFQRLGIPPPNISVHSSSMLVTLQIVANPIFSPSFPNRSSAPCRSSSSVSLWSSFPLFPPLPFAWCIVKGCLSRLWLKTSATS